MKKILLLSSLLILMAIPSLAQTFNLTPANQPDSPIKIEIGKIEFSLLTEWQGREFYQLNAPYILKNVSGKDIRAYKISLYNSNQPYTGVSYLSTAHRSEEIFKPDTEIKSAFGGDNYRKINNYEAGILFVEFTDGTIWRYTPDKDKK
jgi:hypothetical protein